MCLTCRADGCHPRGTADSILYYIVFRARFKRERSTRERAGLEVKWCKKKCQWQCIMYSVEGGGEWPPTRCVWSIGEICKMINDLK